MTFIKPVYRPALTLYQMKIDYIRQALVYFEGNKSKAAEALDIHVRGLRSLCKTTPELRCFYVEPNPQQPNKWERLKLQ